MMARKHLKMEAHQATQCKQRGYKRKSGERRKNCMDIIIQDLKNTDTTWKEAKELAEYKARWR